MVCPAGINLQDLWFNIRETLLQKGYPEFLVLSPLSFYRGLMREETVPKDYEKPLIRAREAIAAQCDLMKKKDKVLPLTSTDRKLQSGLNLSAQAKTFSVCFGCHQHDHQDQREEDAVEGLRPEHDRDERCAREQDRDRPHQDHQGEDGEEAGRLLWAAVHAGLPAQRLAHRVGRGQRQDGGGEDGCVEEAEVDLVACRSPPVVPFNVVS